METRYLFLPWSTGSYSHCFTWMLSHSLIRPNNFLRELSFSSLRRVSLSLGGLWLGQDWWHALLERCCLLSREDMGKVQKISWNQKVFPPPLTALFCHIVYHLFQVRCYSRVSAVFLGCMEISRCLLVTSQVTSSWCMLEQLKTFTPDWVLHSKKRFS